MIREGTNVKWKRGDGYASGIVSETFTRDVTRTIDGNEITRKGEEDNMALLIRQDDGQRVLKQESEVEKA